MMVTLSHGHGTAWHHLSSCQTGVSKAYQGGTVFLLVLNYRHHFRHLKFKAEVESIAAHPTEPTNECASSF